jgi:hypothetical protein
MIVLFFLLLLYCLRDSSTKECILFQHVVRCSLQRTASESSKSEKEVLYREPPV